MSVLRGFFEIGIADALRERGLYDPAVQYEAGDVIGYSADPSDLNANPYIAYMAVADPPNAGIAPPNAPWAQMGAVGTAGRDGRPGAYTVWFFQKAASLPPAPNAADGSVTNGVFTLAGTSSWSLTEPSGTEDLYISFARITPSTNTADYGFVVKLTGDDGAAGPTPVVEYSATGTGPTFDTTPQSNTEYIRFNLNGNRTPWLKIKGDAGEDGRSVSAEYSADNSSWHSVADSVNDKYIRFNIGNVTGTSFKFVGDDGESIDFQFSADTTNGRDGTWHNLPVANTAWIRFRKGTGPWTDGVNIKGRDGSDGDDSLEARYSVGPATTLHINFQPGDKYIHFRIGNTGNFGPAIQFVGNDGANAPNMRVEFASQPVAARFGAFVAGDQYIRFSSDDGATWIPSANGVRFVGEAGRSVTGEGISFEFSEDGVTAWHAQLQAADYFIRLQQGSRGWQTPVQFRAYPLLLQYSIDGSTLWHATFVQGTDKYVRFSNDNGTTWTDGDRFVGEDGSDGADQLVLQYSIDNSTWSNILRTTDLYVRFSRDNGATWSTGVRFVGYSGSEEITLYQRSANEPTSPINIRYNYTGSITADGSYTNRASWSPNVPTGTEKLWRVAVSFPPRTTTDIVQGTVRGSVYSEQGGAGPAGTDGKWFRPVYQWSVNRPADPTGISYSINDGIINGLHPWVEAPATTPPSNNSFLWGALIEIEGSTARYITTWRSSGPQGQAGADSTVPGDDGTDGNSVAVIYTRSATDPTAPTGGTWNGSDYDPPNGWHESVPSGSDPVYTVFVMLSGTNKTNTGITYGPVIRLTGFDGADGRNPPGVGTTIDEVRFGFVADTTDQTITSSRTVVSDTTMFDRGYRNITTFTGGQTGVATQDATGITIPNAGIYSFLVQVDVHLKVLGANAEVGFILHLEDASGDLIDDFIFFNDDIDLLLDANEAGIIVVAYGATPVFSVPAGAKAYLRFFFQTALSSTRWGTSQNLTYRIVTPVEDDDRLVVRRYTNATGSSGTGSGTPGSSIDVVYRRSSTALTVPPSGGVAANGEIRTAPSGWSASVPSGNDPLYWAIAHISGDNTIFYDEPIRVSPIDGRDGAKGNGIYSIWKNSTAPVNTTPTGITIDANGSFTTRDQWTAHPVDPPTGMLQYQQIYEVNFGTSPPTLNPLGTPVRSGPGRPGAASTTPGPDGRPAIGNRNWFIRTATNSAPTAPSLGYTAQTQSWTGFGDWAPDTPPAPPGDGAFIWKVTAVYNSGRNGVTSLAGPVLFNPAQGTNAPRVQFQYSNDGNAPWGAYNDATSGYFRTSEDGGTTWSSARRFRGRDGANAPQVQVQYSITGTSAWGTSVTNPYFVRFSVDGGTTWSDAHRFREDGVVGRNADETRPIFQLNTSQTPARPTVLGTWNLSDYDPPSGWFETPPAATTTQYVVAQWLRLSGVAPATITPLGNPLLIGLRTTTPPPASTATNVRITYGILDTAGNPTGTADMTEEVALEVNETHDFTINMQNTTAANQYLYASVPAAFTITHVSDNLEGDVTQFWPVASGRRRFGPLSLSETGGRYTFTVRRDS